MKKIFSLFLAIALLFSFGTNSETQAASPTDWWTEHDANVSPYVYSLLLDRAGFAAYLYTDTKVSMNPQNLANFEVEERYSDFFIGKFRYNHNKVLVTKDGLIVTYSPKAIAHSTIEKDQHFKDLQSAVKLFVGPTISKVNYINFASLESNKAVSLYFYRGDLTIPSDSKINEIAFSWGNRDGYYGTIIPGSLQPGVTHTINRYYEDKLIDDLIVFKKTSDRMNIFYTSNNSIGYKHSDDDQNFDLTNNFVPVMKDTPKTHWAYADISWAVKHGILRGYENGSFRPENTLTESQFVSVLSKYYDLNTSIDGGSAYNEDGAYIHLKKYNLPLKGYTNRAERNKPVSRGVVAQALSITQNGSSDVRGAVQFLINNDLTTAKSFADYRSNNNLTRSQISAFFQRMDNAGLNDIK